MQGELLQFETSNVHPFINLQAGRSDMDNGFHKAVRKELRHAVNDNKMETEKVCE